MSQPGPTSTKPRVLLVDDRPENLVALEAALRQVECEIVTAPGGREALELLLVDEVALALLDVQMPGMDGFELAELMRGAERTRSIPIIFVSAALRDQARVFKGYETGAVDYLLKPLDPHVLRSKVEVFLELYRQRQQLAVRVGELEAVLAELRRAEARLREADRRKDEFLAVLSHELRNPLLPLRASVHVLEHAPAGGEQAQRALGTIARQVDHLASLVDDLLDVTRISKGKIQLHRQAVDLIDVVRRSIDDHRAAANAGELTLVAELPAGPLTLDADPTRLTQIAANLLGNAIKFTPPGGTVRIEVGDEAGQAVLRVRDDGVGMAPELLGTLFEPFAQADRTLDRSRGGLGLGLTLVRALTEMHGGTIEALSEGPDRGAELVVRLPLAAHLSTASTSGAPASSGAAPRRVLIIEDNPDGAATLAELLRFFGHEVEVACDGLDGLTRARQFQPELVLCDIGLPGIDGFEVARRFKADADLRDVHLVALSGYALSADRQRALDAGFADHLSKPPDIARLKKLLASPPPR
jgi:signal transduction histidine kinase